MSSPDHRKEGSVHGEPVKERTSSLLNDITIFGEKEPRPGKKSLKGRRGKTYQKKEGTYLLKYDDKGKMRDIVT